MSNCASSRCSIEALQDQVDQQYASGFSGGLWGGDQNRAPTAHVAAGQALGRQMAAAGPVVMAAIGFSYARRTFEGLKTLYETDPRFADTLTLVDCAHPGIDAYKLADPNHAYWTTHVPNYLAAAGIPASAVQAAYLLAGNRPKTEQFPAHVATLRSQIEQALNVARTTFPNLKLCYLSPMQYQNYRDPTAPYPVPEAYIAEQGFAFQSIVSEQAAGSSSLAYVSGGSVPWLAWAEPAWCDGLRMRSDGFDWTCPVDVDPDGVHQSFAGRAKMAARLLDTLLGDQSAMPWFRDGGDSNAIGRHALAYRFGTAGPAGSAGVTAIAASRRPTFGATPILLKTQDCPPGARVTFVLGRARQNSPAQCGGFFYVADPVTPFLTSADAQGRAQVVVADAISQTELGDWFAQAWCRDVAAGNRLILSRGLALEVGD